MKKILALILALLMFVTLFSGCGKEEPAAPATPAPTATPTPEPTPASPAEPAEVGYWTLLRTEGDEAMDEDDVKSLKELGIEVFIELKKDGSGVFVIDDPTAITWTDGKISADGESFAYSIEGGQLVCELYGTKYFYVRGKGEAPVLEIPEEPEESAYSWWEGDWYGWWIIDTAYGSYESMEGYFWDAYANIELGEDDTGRMLLWDMDYSKSAPMADVEVFFSYGAGENGAMWAEDGFFMDADIGHAEWVADPAAMGFEIDDMIYIDFVYEDPNNSDNRFNGYIFLRPWGMLWDDLEDWYEDGWPYDDMMPFKYEEWYKPLVIAGAELPDSYDEGVALVEGELYGSGEVLAYGIWEDCCIEVVGAESFIDSDGKDAVRVYYDFTNTSSEDICAMNVLSIEATQDEYDQIETYPDYDENVEESPNAYLYIRPGVTIRCVAEYSMKPSGGMYHMIFIDYWNEVSFDVELDPQNLPGRPPKREVEQIINPKWLNNAPMEGVVGEAYVAIDHADYFVDEYGNDAIRFYVSYTNKSDEACALNWAVYYEAFQDGIELQGAWAGDNAVPEDDMIYEEIQPGETIMTAVSFELRNEQSPVEFQIYDTWTEEIVGHVFELTWGG